MSTYSLSHLADHVLLRDLRALVAQDRTTTAALLAHIAEVDARKLYAPAAYPSMLTYCVGELHLSEEAARKRIHAARTAREFPAIFAAVAEGRLSLSAVVTLATHLTEENADELLAAATHKTRFEIEELIAERSPRPDVLTRLEAVAGAGSPARQETPSFEPLSFERAPGRVDSQAPRPRVEPLSPERYALQVTVGKGTYEKLRHAQALLGHEVPPGEVAEVLDRALDALIARLEKRKFAATDRPRPGPARRSANPRHVPAAVRRAVRQRDGEQCTFVSAGGHRCEARRGLELDHVDPVARGGIATVEGIRLRCRAHNQFTAECTFGAGFMQAKRQEARRRAEEARKLKDTEAGPKRARRQVGAATEPDPDRDVTPWLRSLGCGLDRARSVAELCEATMPDAPIEEKLRFALSKLGERLGRKVSFAAASQA